jgi:hypothetical protein
MAEARCCKCGQALSIANEDGGELTCWTCHPGYATLQDEKLRRVASQRKKVEAEVRKLDKKRTSEAGEGFRQKN